MITLTKNTTKFNRLTATEVRMIPGLSASALRQGQDKLLCLWYILRAYNSSGTGVIDKYPVVDALVRDFHYSMTSVYRLLSQGEGKYWRTVQLNTTTRLNLVGLERVCHCLDYDLRLGRHFNIAAAEQLQTVTLRRATVYASIHAPEGVKTHPISRQSIEAYTGVSKQRQIRLERIAKVRRVPQYAVRRVTERIAYDSNGNRIVITDDVASKYPVLKLASQEETHTMPVKVLVNGKSKQYSINRRLPNAYRSQLKAGGKGMLTRLSRQLSRSLKTGEARGVARRYFGGLRSLVRYWSHNVKGVMQGESFIRLSSSKRQIRGRQEWQIC